MACRALERCAARRGALSLLSGIPASEVCIGSPDIGGGFGNKVPICRRYVCAIVAIIVLG